MNSNLFAHFEHGSHDDHDRRRPLFETDAGACYTYADMDRISAGYAGLFAHLNLQPGARVAARVDKSPEAVFLYLACLRFGLVYLPLNTAYRRRELDFFFADAQPALVVGRPGDESVLAALLPPDTHLYTLGTRGEGTLPDAASAAGPFTECRAVESGETAALVYTSGTTGRPKGAMITHGNLASNAGTLVDAWGFTHQDVLLHVLPLFHVHGLFVSCHCVLWSGARLRFPGGADTGSILRCLPGATVMMGVPTQYTRLLDNEQFGRRQCESVRLFISGSAPLLPGTFEEFERRTGHRILERYGMTETGMNTSNPLSGPRRPGTVGPPLTGIEIRIVDPDGGPVQAGGTGILQVKGPNVFKGYWRRPEESTGEFTDDGYFITGDLASVDDSGYVRIEGRHKDLIISGGCNIYPKEVELCIDAMPEVIESAVIGLPHADYGEAVCAVVVRKPGCTLLETHVIDHVKERLASYKAPKSVYFVDQLARNAMGKVQKNVLRDRFASD